MPSPMIRACALGLLLLGAITGSAAAKLGTGSPQVFLGQKMAYGYAMEKLKTCKSGCSDIRQEAREAVDEWNQCMDTVLLEHKINLRWPDPMSPDYLAQMDFRAQLVEDLIRNGGYMNQLLDHCLPGQTIVLP